jgi:hypothetical protein
MLALRSLILASFLVSSVSLVQGERFAVDGPEPADLEALINFSPLIIEATVESVFPSVQPGPSPMIVTDFMLRVDTVLKGSKPADRIVVHLPGGTVGPRQSTTNQFASMQPGERYLFFLDAKPPTNLLDRGVPRFLIAATFRGMVKVDGERIAWIPGTSASWRARYADLSLTQLRNRIQTLAPSGTR